MSNDKMREAFEQWYAENAFDYVRDPIGSRDCGLQWKAWKACAEAMQQEIADLKQSIINIHDRILRGDSDLELVTMCDAALTGKSELMQTTAQEREACAKLADEYATYGGSNFNEWFKKLAAEIRARGKRHEPENEPAVSLASVQPTIPQSAIIERRKYHKWVDDDGTEDWELFEPDVVCDDSVDVLIIRADAVVIGREPQPKRLSDCWCLTCRPITFSDPESNRMALCPDCGNKRCPKANDHRNACTGSNDVGQPGSAYPKSETSKRLTDEEMIDALQTVYPNRSIAADIFSNADCDFRAIEAKILGDGK